MKSCFSFVCPTFLSGKEEVCVFFCVLLSLGLSIPPPEIKKCRRKLELAVKIKESTVKRSTRQPTLTLKRAQKDAIVLFLYTWTHSQ